MLQELKRFHRDDGGAPELSTIMLIALIALPLIIGLVLFADKLWTRFKDRRNITFHRGEDLLTSTENDNYPTPP